MKENVNQFPNGLHTDNSPIEQPKGTTRFVLNGVKETDQGDSRLISNEESNKECLQLPTGYIPLGKVYIGSNQNIILSVAPDESMSEIGIMDNMCRYTTLVNANLGFRISKQIDIVYRLRRGCERTIYFTTPKPMIFNLDKPENFQDEGGDWDIDKFSLFKLYGSIPDFIDISIEEGGTLMPGAYNFSIQYLDEDLNPTEWITTTEPIKIYNDPVTKNYVDIRGSTSLVATEESLLYQNFGPTSKSIKLTIDNLDTSFPFYRIAIIESNTGTGVINSVKYSQEIPTQVRVFNYTGTNFQVVGTVAEIAQFNSIIDEAEHIEQIENRLILSNVKGKQVNYCKLQRYASKIKADLVLKEIILNAITDANPKTGTVNFDGTGYMPGEMYSFGVVWIFDDKTLSPAYHIPGKNPSTVNTSFTTNGIPMSVDNVLQDTFYTDNSTCPNGDYWGADSEGTMLKNTLTRHHRFPTRGEVGIPLFTEEIIGDDNVTLNQLNLQITGTITSEDPTISYTVVYTVDGVESTFDGTINVETYNPDTGVNIVITTTSGTIAVVEIQENGSVTGNPSPSGLTYNTTIGEAELDISDKLYKSQVFGIQFSGIEKPSLADTNGREVIGYYIVRHERTEDDKSVLDTAVLTPLMKHEFFVAHGHLMPMLSNTDKIKDDSLAIIHPEFKFHGRQYTNIQSMVQEGAYILKEPRSISSTVYQDVMSGTSYDPEVSKRRERDSDGFSLNLLTRDNEVRFQQANQLFASDSIEEVFYLDALASKVVTDREGERKEVFNVSADNKIGIVQLNEAYDTEDILTRLPYVILKRTLTNAYSNFRILPYYKESRNYHRFNPSNEFETIAIFNGDTYVTPMRYQSSVYYDTRLRKRFSKKGLLNTIIGVISVIAGAALILTGAGALLGGMAITYGITQISSGIKKSQIAKVYGELYDAGLKDTVDDELTNDVFGRNPPDDTIQWLGDTITNLWFESSVNMALRQGATYNMTDFLNAPAPRATPGIYGGSGWNTEPQNELDSYLLSKLTMLDSDNGDGRVYTGFATAELYEVNPDYERINKQKVFNHLGIEYDCCSNCLESFPHRNHYSEQSFQEELTDNYRVFLPNNYKDIEGETGVITDLFRIKELLYIHTEEALWVVQPSFQERVTGDIVSFLGTGDFLSIPPRKIVDDSQSSAGTKHKWATLKTGNGVFFVSSNEGKVYQFDGNQLKPISSQGLYSHFKDKGKIKLLEQFNDNNTANYPYDNNPSNRIGTGFISTYDTKKERVIFTKRDMLLTPEFINNPDYQVCMVNGELIVFNQYKETITEQEALGYSYLGIENCRMKFSRTIANTRIEERKQVIVIPNEADVHVFYDTSGSFDTPSLLTIQDSVNLWLDDFKEDNPDWTGTLYTHQTNTNAMGIPDGLINQGGERWVSFPGFVQDSYPGGTDMSTKDIILISFCNESDSDYTDGDIGNPMQGPKADFATDYLGFTDIGGMYDGFNSFIGIHYPIVFTDGIYAPQSRHLLQMILGALKGVSYTETEALNVEYNPGFSTGEWNTLLDSLQNVNPFPEPGLDQFGWTVKTNRYRKPDGSVITPTEFSDDINALLAANRTEITIEVEVTYYTTEFLYVDGTPVDVEELISSNNSWTMSYSLKDESWSSWHSYMPNFYLHTQDKHYSWIQDDSNIWVHGVKDEYQTFYGIYYPHIVEYVSNPDPLGTKIWNHFTLFTEARSYNETYEDYVDERFVTFNKIILYNTRQTTGLVNMLVKDLNPDTADYLEQQVVNSSPNNIIIDRNERNWTLNDFRDIRTNYDLPIFRKDPASLAGTYFIDKVINTDSISLTKDWTQLESFRDKYLVVRLIFDNFDNIRLITNYSAENEQESFR